MDDGQPVGEWTERGGVAAATGVVGSQEGQPPPNPPDRLWELYTEDGQRLQALAWGDGTATTGPIRLELRCQALPRDDLRPGQSHGSVRWPTLPEIVEALALLPEGAMMQLPALPAGAEWAEPTRWTVLQLVQIGAVEGSPAERRWELSGGRNGDTPHLSLET